MSCIAMGATLKGECHRTAEMLVDIAEEKGVYFAVALLADSEYDLARLRVLLPILQAKKGAIK